MRLSSVSYQISRSVYRLMATISLALVKALLALLWDLTQSRAMPVSSYLTNAYMSKMHRLNRHGEARPVAYMRDKQLFRAYDLDVFRSEVDKHNLLSGRCHSGIRLVAHCPPPTIIIPGSTVFPCSFRRRA